MSAQIEIFWFSVWIWSNSGIIFYGKIEKDNKKLNNLMYKKHPHLVVSSDIIYANERNEEIKDFYLFYFAGKQTGSELETGKRR